MGRCCVCTYHAQVCYIVCRGHSSPLPSQLSFLLSLHHATSLPLPCRVLQRGESSRGTCLSPAEPPDSASLSLEYAASFCPRCTSFRKERKKGWLTLYTSVINKYLLCAETVVFGQQYTSSIKVILKSTEWL